MSDQQNADKLASLPSIVLTDALRFLDYASAKLQLTGSRRLNSVYVTRLLPQKRHLLHELLTQQRELGSLYRSQALMARSVAAMYSAMIAQRNEQSQLYERKKQLNNGIGDLINAARAKLEEFHTADGLPITAALAEEKRREVQDLIAKADTLFQQRDALDGQLDQLDQAIEVVEAQSKENKKKFTAGETVLEAVKKKVDMLKEMVAGPTSPPPSTITASSVASSNSRANEVDEGSSSTHLDPPSTSSIGTEAAKDTRISTTSARKRRYSAIDSVNQRNEDEQESQAVRRKSSAES